MVDKILELIDKIGPLFYLIIPATYGVFYKVYLKVKDTKQKEININKKKKRDIYDVWEHEESKNIIYKIKDLCNFYKDKGYVDLVQYLQLENGTMATSKIQNMFVTCLAEDDRYGNIPKMIRKLQRMPYSETTIWLNKVTELKKQGKLVLEIPDISAVEYSRTFVDDLTSVGSILVAPVYDPNEILLGVCIFYYHDKDFNKAKDVEEAYLTKFTSAVESIILDYHIHRDQKKKDLGLEGE